MRWLLFIGIFVVTLVSAECLTNYRLRGHIPSSTNERPLTVGEIKNLVNEEISNVLHDAHPVVSHIREVPRKSKSSDIFPSSMMIEMELTLISEMPDSIFRTKKIRFASFKEIDSVRDTSDPDPDCYNEGYMGPDGYCICPEQYTGYNCALLNCWNGGIPDYYLNVPQCFCSPGYNDFFCANRGCRPAILDDINPPITNLIVIMPATKSFYNPRQQIMKNFEFLVNALNTYEDTPWLGLFVGVNYWATEDFPDDTSTDIFMTSNLTEFINRMAIMDNLKLGNIIEEDQSLLEAIDLSLWDTFDGQVSAYPMVLGYSNSPNKRAEYLDDSFTLQANYWRAKVYINIINDNTTQINTTSDGFNDYHSYSQLTHSPLLYYTADEIDVVHSTVMTRIYKPQYIDVRSQISGTGSLVEAMRDYQDNSRLMQVLVTFNQPMAQGNLSLITLVGNISIPSDTSGSYFAIYTIPATSWDGYRYSATTGSTFSFYTFISSSETALWAGHDDTNTDIGDIVNSAEGGYHFAVTPVAFKKPVIGIEYQSIGSTNAQIIYKAKYLNSKPGCTLNYEFEKIAHCTPGTFVHQVVLFTESGAVTRVYPGYCVHTTIKPKTEAGKDPISFSVRPSQTTTVPAVMTVCPIEGSQAFADNRNHPFRDFIFAIEWTNNDYSYILDILGTIPNLVNSIYDMKYQQRFTFIVFNKNTVNTVVSQTRRDLFEQRILNLVMDDLTHMWNNQMNNTETSSDSIDSVIMANLQTLNPKGQAYIWTQTVGQQSQHNLLKVFPKSFQVNYFWHTRVYDSYPFSLMTRQTNGRWYSAQAPGTFIGSFLPETVKSELIYDEIYQAPPGMPLVQRFLVEKSATLIEVLINGNVKNYTVVDSIGAPLHYNNSFDGTMGMLIADVSNRSTEEFTLSVDCEYCTVQIRVASPLRVILAFTADLDDDTKYQTEPSAWIRMNTTAKVLLTYVAARVTGLDTAESVTKFKVTAMMGSFRGPSFTANSEGYNGYMSSQMQLRNSSKCSYQWIGQIHSFYEQMYWGPDLDGMKFLIEITTDKNTTYTRMVYYYLPAELKNSPCPNGGSLDFFGVCQCTSDFTGELCTVPVCRNNGVQNFGVCNCGIGYRGRFCEIAITEMYFANETTTSVTTTVPIESTFTMKTTNPLSTQSTRAPVSSTNQNSPVVTMPTSTVPTASQSSQGTTKAPTAPPTTLGTKSTGKLLVFASLIYILLSFL